MAAPLNLSAVVFAHAVNSTGDLARALADKHVNFLEADVICDTGGVAVMGHDPGTPSDLRFEDFLAAARTAHVGVKVDLKQAAATAEVLAKLTNAESTESKDPSWPILRVASGGGTTERFLPALIVNADVLQGPGARDGCSFFDGGGETALSPESQVEAAAAFLSAAHAAVPRAVLSPGWTTAGEGRAYTAAHVDAMLRVCGRVCDDAGAAAAAPVFTFPVRGSYVRESWPELARLLSSVQQGGRRQPQQPGTGTEDAAPRAAAAAAAGAAACAGLTVWSNVPLPPEELAWLRSHLDPATTMYDVKGAEGASEAAGSAAGH